MTLTKIDPIAYAAQIRRDRGLALLLQGTAVLAAVDAGQALEAAGAANTPEVQRAVLDVAAKLMSKDDNCSPSISTPPPPPTPILPATTNIGRTCPICHTPIGPPPAVACPKHWRQVRARLARQAISHSQV